jgi:hypothetical protein
MKRSTRIPAERVCSYCSSQRSQPASHASVVQAARPCTNSHAPPTRHRPATADPPRTDPPPTRPPLTRRPPPTRHRPAYSTSAPGQRRVVHRPTAHKTQLATGHAGGPPVPMVLPDVTPRPVVPNLQAQHMNTYVSNPRKHTFSGRSNE